MEHGKPKVVLMDLVMPGMSGMEVLERIHQINPHTVTIVITGYGSVLSRLEAARLGVSDYIEKPFTPERVTRSVRRALAPPTERPEAKIPHLWRSSTRMKGVAASVSFRRYSPQDWFGLLQMYLTFEPKAAYQGLPPFKEATTRRWLSHFVGNPSNTNFILKLGQEVIAHTALVYYPNRPLDEEIIIFVHQKHQRRGWGRKLFLAAMNWACLHLKLRRLWLSVESYNVRARRLYASLGFVPVPSRTLETEIEMERPLQCRNCLKHKCPIFGAELMRAYTPI